MGGAATKGGQPISTSPGYTVTTDKTPLVANDEYPKHPPHPPPARPEMSDMMTSMSDFGAMLGALEEGGAVGGGVLSPPRRAVPVGVVEVQTDPWEPQILAAQQQMVYASAGPKTKGPLDVNDIWVQVDSTCQEMPKQDLVVKRSGWKTVRIFVSSTFKDFHYEREVLVKEVFPDLRNWCEQRRLHLVECDLRWGIPKDSTSELTLKTCLGEIDRCYQDNIMPFFVNMTSERIGWIPLEEEVPPALVNEYRWIFGLSVTEMEIVHGAYRRDNPNSIFLLRQEDFLNEVPEKYKKEFIDENVLAPDKLKMLKKMLTNRFPSERIIKYKSSYEGQDPTTKKLRFKLDDNFRFAVFEFFKKRIEQQYPLYDEDDDPLERSREAHEAFMKSRCESVLGRQQILREIENYVCYPDQDVPFLILGQPGTGKSSIMAKAADDILTMAKDGKIPGGGETGWRVFHHFVGAVPGSTDLKDMLCRLLKELGAVDAASMPSDLDNAVGGAVSALNNAATPPVIVFVDALNQLDEDQAALQCSWVPRKLPPNVRCVFSLINTSTQHNHLMERESKPKECFVPPLDLAIRKDMVTEFLGKFNKQLDMDQMFSLLSKRASENPLWLSIACEELRVFGNFREVSDKINSLPDGLLDLLTTVLGRFESEGGCGDLLVATLCLIEVSTFGLLESELLTILADEDGLLPPDLVTAAGIVEKGEKEESEKSSKKKKNNKKKDEKAEKGEKLAQLPAMKWAAVYRSLRPFLRPFGDSGEGRLDFYHRTLSKVVRKKYLKVVVKDADAVSIHPNALPGGGGGASGGDEEEEVSPAYKWWHMKLADYFHKSENYDRKVEEYPYHLQRLKDHKRLEQFLCEWPAIDRLYDVDFSGKLLKYWNSCGGIEAMVQAYSELLQDLKDSISEDELCSRYLQMGKIIMQGGKLDQALALAEEAMKLETEKLGKRPASLVDVYELLGAIWDQKTKAHEFCSRDQVPEIEKCLEYQSKCIEIIRSLPQTRKNKHKLAKQLVSQGFTLASLGDCGGSTDMPKEKALETGEKNVNDALDILKELQDTGKIAEAIMTKAVLIRYDRNKQLKLYSEAEELCKQAYGEYHPLMARINLNTGIVYEDNGEYQKSYDYFRRNLTVALEVYGKEHSRAQRSLGIMREPMYARIARQRGDVLPE